MFHTQQSYNKQRGVETHFTEYLIHLLFGHFTIAGLLLVTVHISILLVAINGKLNAIAVHNARNIPRVC